MSNTALEQGRDSRMHLAACVRTARKAREEMEPFWKKYQEEIKGRQRRKGKGPKRLTNYPYLFERTFIAQLSASNPDVWVQPVMAWSDAQIAEAEGFALVEVMRRQKFIDELRRCVRDGMYAFMFRKVGMVAGGDDIGGLYGDSMWLDATMPFFERISPFDAIWDDAADDFKQNTFCGHEFTRDLDSVVGDDRYDSAARAQAEDNRAALRESTKDKYAAYDDDEIPPSCNLIELFVRPTRQIYTLLEKGKNEFLVLRKMPFYGPAMGPYDMRAFADVGDTPGMSPAAAWWDAYVEYELNMQKANESAQAEKRVATTKEENAEGAKRYKNAKSDDLVVGVGDITEVQTGGVTTERMNWAASRKAELEMLSGVSAARLGVAQGGKTATADVIANENASAGVNGNRRHIMEFAEDALDGMKWYIHNEPSFAIRTTVHSMEGLPAEIGVQGGPEVDPFTGQPLPDQRPAEDFRVKIDPKSLYQEDDTVRAAKAVQDAGFVLTTLRPALMTQGHDINLIGMVRQLEQRTGMDFITRNLIPLNPMAMQLQQMAMAGAPSPEGAHEMARPGEDNNPVDAVQSQVMNSGPTNGALSQRGQGVSLRRKAATMPGSNNRETSPL